MKELTGTTIKKYESFDEVITPKTSTIRVSNEFFEKFQRLKHYVEAMERHMKYKFFKKGYKRIVKIGEGR